MSIVLVAITTLGLVVSALASKTRQQAMDARGREEQTAILFRLSKDLAASDSLEAVLRSIRMNVGEIFDCRVAVFWRQTTGLHQAVLTLVFPLTNMKIPSLHGFLETAYDESGHMNQLVDNLLDMTRVETGALKMKTNPCKLKDVIGASLYLLKDKLEKREIHIRIPRDLPEIFLDFTLVMRVFVNLIDNAMKYSAPDTPIEITVKLLENKMRKLMRKEKGRHN
ncbi:sensor histidine kinase [Candidatus Brocadia sinica]|uniref:Osmosensitive K+ channel histidine kinase n=1 Tax=Candidatus Brocadia sinica JPN1 TaxID=1197129 RepID=A0ABQ0K3B7_9BACT|nr:ATP-binding protein [Candidatus Brocadia sinica]GAN35388.1 osmosensitive K+ channel histidine kinase [Candidatus Brocadia sinica JPN1]